MPKFVFKPRVSSALCDHDIIRRYLVWNCFAATASFLFCVFCFPTAPWSENSCCKFLHLMRVPTTILYYHLLSLLWRGRKGWRCRKNKLNGVLQIWDNSMAQHKHLNAWLITSNFQKTSTIVYHFFLLMKCRCIVFVLTFQWSIFNFITFCQLLHYLHLHWECQHRRPRHRNHDDDDHSQKNNKQQQKKVPSAP